MFEREAERIRRALGDRVLRIEHTGSTAVPGLAAKPVIDMALVVRNSAAEADYRAPLEDAGYSLLIQEPEWYEHRMFKGPDVETNLHVFSDQCPEVQRVLMFRDWLRGNDADRDLYAGVKMALAEKEWGSVDEYASAKTQVIEEILSRAAAGRKSDAASFP